MENYVLKSLKKFSPKTYKIFRYFFFEFNPYFFIKFFPNYFYYLRVSWADYGIFIKNNYFTIKVKNYKESKDEIKKK